MLAPNQESKKENEVRFPRSEQDFKGQELSYGKQLKGNIVKNNNQYIIFVGRVSFCHHSEMDAFFQFITIRI